MPRLHLAPWILTFVRMTVERRWISPPHPFFPEARERCSGPTGDSSLKATRGRSRLCGPPLRAIRPGKNGTYPRPRTSFFPIPWGSGPSVALAKEGSKGRRASAGRPVRQGAGTPPVCRGGPSPASLVPSPRCGEERKLVPTPHSGRIITPSSHRSRPGPVIRGCKEYGACPRLPG